jgi:predicted O-methyltransferase YrrM
MKTINIINKLKNLGFEINDLSLGDFDLIGEWCAKKQRSSDSDLYKSVGAFFRPNYERGLLIYALIMEYDIKSFLEIGFGRGYSTLCAAMAMCDNGGGSVTTIDPNFDQLHIDRLKQTFPKEWFDMITFISGYSQNYLFENDDDFDFIYVDGDHKYDAIKRDWNLCEKRYNKIILFDDYYMPSKIEENEIIECAKLIDSIEDDSKELIIMDRRIFFDDRKLKDDEINYGQVLLTKE